MHRGIELFLTTELAMEAVQSGANTMDWGAFDLDDDGTVDRLLILHSTKGQEENPRESSIILLWRQFSQL